MNKLAFEKNNSLIDDAPPPKKKPSVYVILILIAVLGFACGIIGIISMNNTIETLSYTINETQLKLDKAKDTLALQNGIIDSTNAVITNMNIYIDSLQSSLSDETNKSKEKENELKEFKGSVSSYIPLLITNIEIANVNQYGYIETHYGGIIYSSKSMYLKPRITYIGIKEGIRITLHIKLYDTSGKVNHGKNAPSGYSFLDNLTVLSGSGNTFELKGFGDTQKHWQSGTYRYEIWYGDICLKAKTFIVYNN